MKLSLRLLTAILKKTKLFLVPGKHAIKSSFFKDWLDTPYVLKKVFHDSKKDEYDLRKAR